MSITLGLNGVVHRNTGTYGTPTWDAVPNVSGVKTTIQGDWANGRTRSSGLFHQGAITGIMFGATFKMLWDKSDTDFAAFLAAAYGATEIDCTILDGTTASGSHQGPRFHFAFTKFDRAEGEDEIMMADVEVKPGMTAVPVWFTGTA